MLLTMNNNLTTYIVCGGKSSRMGSDKASFLLNGKSFLQHITESASKLKNEIKLISSLKKHENLNYPLVPDLKKEKGPVCGITSALSDSKTENNLILSCDIPFIEYNALHWLIGKHSINYDATVISCNQKKMPLIGIYNTACLKTFKTHLEKDHLKLMNVLNNLNVNYVEVPEKWTKQVANINTQEQLKAIQI